MNRRPAPQRPSPFFALLLLGGAVVAIAAIALVGLWAWQRASEIQALHLEVITLHRAHQQAQEQVAALQATASALEQGLTDLQAENPTAQEDPAPASGVAAGEEQALELQSSLQELSTRLDRLESSLHDVVGRLQALEGTAGLPPEPMPAQARLSVAAQKQSRNLSCESSAAAMTAQYHGVSLTEADVLAALPRADNPYLGFRGSVDGPPGGIEDYGVYAGPILDVLEATGLRAALVEGGLEGIKAAIARGHPVIAWITYDCQHSTPVTRTVEGQVVSLVPYQHVVVVTGYSAKGVWANDPWDGREEFYPAADFVRALAYFDDMAIEVAAP